jgi:hypothetical protein
MGGHMRMVLILLMLLWATNSPAVLCHDEQEEIFTVSNYKYRLSFNAKVSAVNEDLLIKDICRETCSKISKKYEDYIANGWRTDIVIPQQLLELSPDREHSSYKDEIGRLEESCQGPCFNCQCFGVKYVMEK